MIPQREGASGRLIISVVTHDVVSVAVVDVRSRVSARVYAVDAFSSRCRIEIVVESRT